MFAELCVSKSTLVLKFEIQKRDDFFKALLLKPFLLVKLAIVANTQQGDATINK